MKSLEDAHFQFVTFGGVSASPEKTGYRLLGLFHLQKHLQQNQSFEIEFDEVLLRKYVNLSIDKFQCLKDNGYMFFIGRIWKSLGEFDWDGLQNVKNAFEAGLYVSVYIFPCLDFPKCAPVQDQVEETINRLNDEGVKYGVVFLDIQLFDWPSNKTENRQTIDAMGQKLDEMGVEWGIYTNKRNWNGIVGDWDKWNHKKLWWAFWGNNDGERYSDFKPFGGWTDFYMQQYAGDFNGPCSVVLDLDYYA